MSERRLIASLIQSRQAFDRVVNHLESASLSEQSRVVVDHLTAYYSRDPEAKRAEPDILARDIGRAMSNPKHRESFEELVSALSEVDTSPENVVHDYIAVRREAVGAKLGIALTSGEPTDEVRSIIAEYEEWCTAESLDSDERDEAMPGQPLRGIGDWLDPARMPVLLWDWVAHRFTFLNLSFGTFRTRLTPLPWNAKQLAAIPPGSQLARCQHEKLSRSPVRRSITWSPCVSVIG